MQELVSREEIARRVAAVGREITEFYRGKPLQVVAIANGGMVFSADLVREIPLPLELDSVAVNSYEKYASTGVLHFRSELKLDPAEKHLLLTDDVLDTGCTMARLVRYFRERGAASVRIAVAVEKEFPRPPEIAHADWRCFVLPDRYLVGYGMDADERYRNLPYIAAFDDGTTDISPFK